jgi:hypothetical protein
MRARLVSELYKYSSENQLYESILNEKINIENFKKSLANVRDKNKLIDKLLTQLKGETTNINIKKNIGIALILIYLVSLGVKNNKWAGTNDLLKKSAIELVAKDNVKREDIKVAATKIIDFEKKIAKPIFSVGAAGLIEEINKIAPNRLENNKISNYDKYDNDILKAVENLKAKGETANPDLLKAIMLIETGMRPRKNKLGYDGFPQTKQHIIDGVNKRSKTNFTIEDMYNAEKSAEFVHYYIKTLKKSQYVNDLEDIIIAYNWGMGNLGKYKRGEKSLPNQSKNYVAMIKVLQKYFS